jgi:NifU-like protein involved in Fe-S cluster formation
VTGGGRAVLYTPEILTLAVSLGARPFDPSKALTGDARSQTCGSTINLSLACDARGRIEAIGIRASACAIGQAAAAIFAGGAAGQDRPAIADARDAIVRWLSEAGPQPEWPGIAALEAARGYPARHGAILLAWTAALAALPKETPAR